MVVCINWQTFEWRNRKKKMRVVSKLFFVSIFIFNSVAAQKSLAATDSAFVRYLVYEFLPSLKLSYNPSGSLHKINDREIVQLNITRSLHELAYIQLRKYLTDNGVHGKDSSDMINRYWNTPSWTAKNILPDSLLVNMDSVVHYDSVHAYHSRAFDASIPAIYRSIANYTNIHLMPDSVRQVMQYHYDQFRLNYKKYIDLCIDAAYITAPFFFDENRRCYVAFRFFLMDLSNTIIVLFKREKNNWAVEKFLYNRNDAYKD